MSRKKLVGVLVGVALLACGTEKLCAQAQDINETCTFTGTIIIQNTNTDINLNPKSPLMLKVTTKDLLAVIGRAEYYSTNYPSTNFPSGAKLIKNGTQGFVQFSVWGKTNNVLIDDCTDVVGLDVVDIGAWTAANGLTGSYTETDYGDADFYIFENDTGGVVDLTMSGYLVNTIKNSPPNKNSGMVNSSQAFTIKAAGGTGSTLTGDAGENAVLTGSFSAKGTAQTF